MCIAWRAERMGGDPASLPRRQQVPEAERRSRQGRASGGELGGCGRDGVTAQGRRENAECGQSGSTVFLPLHWLTREIQSQGNRVCL